MRFSVAVILRLTRSSRRASFWRRTSKELFIVCSPVLSSRGKANLIEANSLLVGIDGNGLVEDVRELQDWRDQVRADELELLRHAREPRRPS